MQHPSLAIPIEAADARRGEPRAGSGNDSTAPALRGSANDGTAPALRGAVVRRTAPRSTLRVRCSCATEPEFVQRYAADISARGMFLRTTQPLPLGARVRFELLLQSGRCALGGVGRVAWLRAADPALGRAAGAGIAFERLRRGDRAVIERMDLARGELPSRFEQPDLPVLVQAPRGVELAKLLFADLSREAGHASDAGGGQRDDSSAFLSADLSKELGEGGWRHGRSGSSELVADLAEQLEPGLEARDGEEALEVEHAAPRTGTVVAGAAEPEAHAQHSTVRPAALPPAEAMEAEPVAVRGAQAVTARQGQGRPSRPTAAPALRARIQALRPSDGGTAPSLRAGASSGVTAPASRGDASAAGGDAAPPVRAHVPEARVLRPRNAQRLQPATKRALDRQVSTDALERASAVPVALVRAAVERAGAPQSAAAATSSASARAPAASEPTRGPSGTGSNPPPLRVPAPARPAPRVTTRSAGPASEAPLVAAALTASDAPAPVRRPRASTWPLAFLLCAIIILASAVTYLALSDQLPNALSALGLSR